MADSWGAGGGSGGGMEMGSAQPVDRKEAAMNKVAGDIGELQRLVKRLEKLSNMLGTPKDTTKFRSQLDQERHVRGLDGNARTC